MSDNQQRAAELLYEPWERVDHEGDIARSILRSKPVQHLAAALDEAEARGRAEVADQGHEIVVEVYDGIALSMKCIPCRARIPVRPERAAAQLAELNYLAREHAEAIARLDHGITS